MMVFLIGFSGVVDKFVYLYSKMYNISRQEVLTLVRNTDTRSLSKKVEDVLNLPPKEAYHYAEIIKDEISFKGGSSSSSERLNAVSYVGCSSTTQNWQWGTDATIPAGCSGTDRCWGTVLGGSYVNIMDDTLYSPIINAVGYNRVVLTFNHYYNIESGFDQGYVLCSPDGGTTWNVVGGPYSGGSVGWVAETLDISVCGNTSNLRVAFAFHSDGSITYEGWYVDDVTILGSTVLSSVILYSSSFEGTDDGDLVPVTIGTGSVAPWQRGVPTSGPGAARFGTNVWATNLTGDYNSSADEAIQKQTAVPLSGGYSAYILRFYHWYDTETSFDSGWVEISTDGGATWTKVSPGYKGHSATWYTDEVDLTPYAGSNLLFRFRFQSDGSVVYPGWYIDSVSIKGENYTPPSLLAYYSFDLNDGGFTATSSITSTDPYSITNNYLEWWFDILLANDFGTYTARTGISHTYPNITLLYGAQFSTPSVWSSWTTIHSVNSSTDYIGKNGTATPPAGFTQDNLKNYASQVICEPSVPRVTFVYDIRNGVDTLLVKEIFWITGTDVNTSRLWHKTVVINQSSSCASVGVRWQYDTHVDAMDHPAQYQCDYYPALTLSCGAEIANPVQVGPPVPSTFDFLRESDVNPPAGTKYHLFAVYYNGTTVSVPDFVYHARWPNAHDNTWTYALATTDDITVETGLDNAFVYFWNPVTCILPGDSIVYESFFGSPTNPVGNDSDLGIYERGSYGGRLKVTKGGILTDGREEITVYSVSGQQVFKGRAERVTLHRGVYFVRIGKRTFRVVIR